MSNIIIEPPPAPKENVFMLEYGFLDSRIQRYIHDYLDKGGYGLG